MFIWLQLWKPAKPLPGRSLLLPAKEFWRSTNLKSCGIHEDVRYHYPVAYVLLLGDASGFV